jgi:2-C-methyl-D-erythritol 4-phosphate cytidylyltransferase
MKVSAIIVAAGSGSRLGSTTPKAFVQLGSRSLLYCSLRTIAQLSALCEAIITVPAGMEAAARAEAAQAGLGIPLKITPGGLARQDSVRIALELTSAESECVVIHDAARPFATPAMFEDALRAAAEHGAAIAAIPIADTLKRVESGAIVTTVARAALFQAQTPQAFRRDLLKRAHRLAVQNKVAATDDADLVERLGASVRIIEGSPRNLKITTPADLEIAQALIRAASQSPG